LTIFKFEQRIEKLQEIKAPKEDLVLRFHQPEALKLHNKFPVMGDRISLKAGNKTLLTEASFQFPLGSTIAIRGNNGSGKSTLLRYIYQNKEGIILSPKALIGYYDQMGYQFAKDESMLAYMKERSDYEERKIRAVLHAMNFAGNDLKKNVRNLSGGERVRLELCQLFLGSYNVLILDEPTNFLDVFCIEALERFIKAFEGTVILVSHDFTFINRVADHIYVIENQKLVLRK
jgi:macrolide transport system ATP-binding/permease protein